MFSGQSPRSTSPILHFHSSHVRPPVSFISIPHSGEVIPEEFRPFLSGDQSSYQEDVDFQVHQLIDLEKLQQKGTCILQALIHRVAVDLNRSPDKSVLHWEFNTKGKKIRLTSPDPALTEKLLQSYYTPYYEMVKSTLQELERVYGQDSRHPVPAIDLHSMPSRPTEYHMKINPNQKAERPDFCISDLRGTSCQKDFLDFLTHSLRDLGYEALVNEPYFGGNVTEYMHRFRTNAVQIEIKRGIYMDEDKKCLLPHKVAKLKGDLTSVLLATFDRFGR